MEGQKQVHNIEELRASANNEALSTEEREVAFKLLATLEKPKPKSIADILAVTFANIEANADAYRADQIARFKVCSSCCFKQPKDNNHCELCGQRGPWESPVPDSAERTRFIAMSTSYSEEELNYLIEHSSNVVLAGHSAKVLELRGVERVKSFWENAGFTITGASLNK